MIKPKGIAFKTFIFTALLISLVVAVSFGILYLVLPDYYLYTKNKTLQKNSDLLALKLNAAVSEEECKSLISAFVLANNAEVTAFDGQGLFLPALSSPFVSLDQTNFLYMTSTADEEPLDPEQGFYVNDLVIKLKEPERSATSETKTVVSVIAGKKLRVQINDAKTPVLVKTIPNGLIGQVSISATLQPIDEAKGVIVSLLPYLFALDILIALLAAYLYARQLSKPILQISGAAAKMQRLAPDALSNIRTGDELGQLSRNLDALYVSLCASIEDIGRERDKANKLQQSKTNFMRSAGHDLKTPIAALNGIIEGMIDNVGVYKDKEKYLKESKNLIDQLARLVSEILKVSQLDELEDSIVCEEINLREIINQLLLSFQLFIEEKDLQIEQNILDRSYYTDRRIFFTTLANLISNAVNYTEAGGKIILSLTEAANGLVLSIENQCAPIAEELLFYLFEPFYTLSYHRDKTKNGTGLGLYIVKKNLETLQIPVKLENTQLGLKVSLYLPPV